jgi:hypothetical protein
MSPQPDAESFEADRERLLSNGGSLLASEELGFRRYAVLGLLGLLVV